MLTNYSISIFYVNKGSNYQNFSGYVGNRPSPEDATKPKPANPAPSTYPNSRSLIRQPSITVHPDNPNQSASDNATESANQDSARPRLPKPQRQLSLDAPGWRHQFTVKQLRLATWAIEKWIMLEFQVSVLVSEEAIFIQCNFL